MAPTSPNECCAEHDRTRDRPDRADIRKPPVVALHDAEDEARHGADHQQHAVEIGHITAVGRSLEGQEPEEHGCLLYTSDAADE
mgnify:CR=1 FL=1